MNRGSYNKIAHAWGSARSGFFGREREYIDAVLSAVPKGSTILDVGCGTGRPMAEYVISQGHHVVGVDQSEEMLEIAGRAHLGFPLPREAYRARADHRLGCRLLVAEYMNLPDGGRDKGRYAIVAEKA
jgi:SAM-dependent methyltransferase